MAKGGGDILLLGKIVLGDRLVRPVGVTCSLIGPLVWLDMHTPLLVNKGLIVDLITGAAPFICSVEHFLSKLSTFSRTTAPLLLPAIIINNVIPTEVFIYLTLYKQRIEGGTMHFADSQ